MRCCSLCSCCVVWNLCSLWYLWDEKWEDLVVVSFGNWFLRFLWDEKWENCARLQKVQFPTDEWMRGGTSDDRGRGVWNFSISHGSRMFVGSYFFFVIGCDSERRFRRMLFNGWRSKVYMFWWHEWILKVIFLVFDTSMNDVLTPSQTDIRSNIPFLLCKYGSSPMENKKRRMNSRFTLNCDTHSFLVTPGPFFRTFYLSILVGTKVCTNSLLTTNTTTCSRIAIIELFETWDRPRNRRICYTTIITILRHLVVDMIGIAFKSCLEILHNNAEKKQQ